MIKMYNIVVQTRCKCISNSTLISINYNIVTEFYEMTRHFWKAKLLDSTKSNLMPRSRVD